MSSAPSCACSTYTSATVECPTPPSRLGSTNVAGKSHGCCWPVAVSVEGFPSRIRASQIPPSASGEVGAAVGRGKGILGSGGGGKRVTPKCGKLGTWTEFGGGFKGEEGAWNLSFPSVFLSRPPDDNACASSWMLSGNYKNNPLVVSSALPIQPFQTMRDEDIFLPWPSPSFTGLG